MWRRQEPRHRQAGRVTEARRLSRIAEARRLMSQYRPPDLKALPPAFELACQLQQQAMAARLLDVELQACTGQEAAR